MNVKLRYPLSGHRVVELEKEWEEGDALFIRVRVPGWKWPVTLLDPLYCKTDEPVGNKSSTILPPPKEKSSEILGIYDRGTRTCICGCGSPTKKTFAPGHDSKVKSKLRGLSNGENIEISKDIWDYVKNNSYWFEQFGHMLQGE